jgi:hypothetical protein
MNAPTSAPATETAAKAIGVKRRVRSQSIEQEPRAQARAEEAHHLLTHHLLRPQQHAKGPKRCQPICAV